MWLFISMCLCYHDSLYTRIILSQLSFGDTHIQLLTVFDAHHLNNSSLTITIITITIQTDYTMRPHRSLSSLQLTFDIISLLLLLVVSSASSVLHPMSIHLVRMSFGHHIAHWLMYSVSLATITKSLYITAV